MAEKRANFQIFRISKEVVEATIEISAYPVTLSFKEEEDTKKRNVEAIHSVVEVNGNLVLIEVVIAEIEN